MSNKKISLNSAKKRDSVFLARCMPLITGEHAHALNLAVIAGRGRRTPNLSKNVKKLFKKYELLGYKQDSTSGI